MTNLFRNIRRQLASDNKPIKYLRYAIGEIVLVVIGILIALSINNWNVKRLENKSEIKFLEGIKSDLRSDMAQVDSIINLNVNQLNIIAFLDPTFELDSHLKTAVLDTINWRVKNLFIRQRSFRSTSGTYNSLIADGLSSLIRNRKLFEDIQKIYDNHSRISSIYDVVKLREDKITWKYPYLRNHLKYSDLIGDKNNRLVSELTYFWEESLIYCQYLIDLKDEMKNVISKINAELSQDKS